MISYHDDPLGRFTIEIGDSWYDPKLKAFTYPSSISFNSDLYPSGIPSKQEASDLLSAWMSDNLYTETP